MISRKFVIFIFLVIFSYIVSLVNFIQNIDIENNFNAPSKNIVVLTGNAGRLKAATDLMALNEGSSLLISGVAKGVKYAEIIKNNLIDKEKVELGYNAQSTFGNAIETKIWTNKNNFKDFILITDDWHMKRSLLLFTSSMPNIKIFPYGLKSNYKGLKEHFLFEEHLKYLVSHIQVIYLWIIN